MDSHLQLSKALLNDFNSMPYYQNYAAASGAVHNISKHEDAVKDILMKHGFKNFDKPSVFRKETAWSWINTPSLATSMPPMSFILQPCGTQDNPDFIVKIKDNVVFGLECKSSKDTSPEYNSGGLTQNYIYVFSSQRTNSTTTYMGSDIVTPEQQKLIDEHREKHRKEDAILNEKLKLIDTNHRGVYWYTRPMIEQQGGKSYNDYFEHKSKTICQENVFKFLENMISSS